MNKVLFGLAFILGAIAVVGMSWVFVGNDSLALLITLVIGVVYTIGTVELLRFQKATRSLFEGLKSIPDFHTPDGEDAFPTWLSALHSSLRNSVQLRIEGERMGLPAPIITPYLVGLLVMLGLLGTFVGMVDTLQGAVTALQGTTELEAIRAGLAAPINGLGLAFGTSVAGVAASAMLGLMSTLSRRERIVATRDLDACISSEFKGFSLVHNRQETYKALQAQAKALPAVAEQLESMANKLASMGDKLGEQLNQKQDRFHHQVETQYEGLAKSVSETLVNSLNTVQQSLSESGRLAGESIRPVIEDSMQSLVSKVLENTQEHNARFAKLSAEHLSTLDNHFASTATKVSEAWQSAIDSQESHNQDTVVKLEAALVAYSESFEQKTAAMLDQLNSDIVRRESELQDQDQTRLALWQSSMTGLGDKTAQVLQQGSDAFAEQLQKVLVGQQEATQQVAEDFSAMTSSLASMSEGISRDWQGRADQVLKRQQDLTELLSDTQLTLDQQTKAHSVKVLDEMERLFSSSDKLLVARQENEDKWIEAFNARMDTLSQNIHQELASLRDEEANRSEQASGHMAALQGVFAKQLGELTETLEQPMARLIATASETPKAAAEVISKLKDEISKNMARDNELLSERQRIMSELDGLSSSLSQSSEHQRDAVASLVETSGEMLEKISTRFDEHIDTEVNKLSEIIVEAAASTTDIASLGEAFGDACRVFSQSNQHLSESLQGIESALAQSSERSNEQLAYYVAQARDVIDHSVMSQKSLFEELRELSEKQQFALQTPESV